jgi:hypothetical protein
MRNMQVSRRWRLYLPLYCTPRHFYGNGKVLAANTIPFIQDCNLLFVSRHSLYNAGAAHPSTTPFALGWLFALAPLYTLVVNYSGTIHFALDYYVFWHHLFTLNCCLLWHHPLHTEVLLTLAPSHSLWFATYSGTILFTLVLLLILIPLSSHCGVFSL